MKQYKAITRNTTSDCQLNVPPAQPAAFQALQMSYLLHMTLLGILSTNTQAYFRSPSDTRSPAHDPCECCRRAAL